MVGILMELKLGYKIQTNFNINIGINIGMGNDNGGCLGKRKPIDKPPIPPIKTDVKPQNNPKPNSNIPKFMDPYIGGVINQRKLTLFNGVIDTFHGELRDQWIKIDTNFEYRGEWAGQNRHGRGMLYNKPQKYLVCSCFYQNNLITHKCRKIYSNQTEYIGQLNDKYQMHGNGKVMGKKFTYQGGLKNNRFDGQGQLERFQSSQNQKKQVSSFKGTFQNGRRKNGIEITKQGTYEGVYENDQRQGQGVFHWINGGKYEGPFAKNKMHGNGKLYDTQGNFVGRHTFQNGILII